MRAVGLTALLLATAACGASSAEERPELPPSDPLNGVEPALLFQQGETLANEGDLVRAEQYMSAALDRGYPEERGLPILVRVCVNASRIRAALQYATPFLERHPSNWALRFVVASLQLGLGHPDIARDELLRVVESAPDQPDPHYLLGVTLADNFQDAEGARTHFARYVQLAPRGAHAEEARARMSARAEGSVPGHAVQVLGPTAPTQTTATVTIDGGTP
ncbi:MAG: tetratricopeptide repeat protein [Sandaracinaceae bacterium]|nr:tetratricopeptide repeat protein [Sandaracinaceae bacterium]